MFRWSGGGKNPNDVAKTMDFINKHGDRSRTVASHCDGRVFRCDCPQSPQRGDPAKTGMSLLTSSRNNKIVGVGGTRLCCGGNSILVFCPAGGFKRRLIPCKWTPQPSPSRPLPSGGRICPNRMPGKIANHQPTLTPARIRVGRNEPVNGKKWSKRHDAVRLKT
jgi:hypothetical protein